MLPSVANPAKKAETEHPHTAIPPAQKPRSWRRINRALETDTTTIRAALRPGFTRPNRASDVLDVIEMHPQWALLYQRRRNGLKAVLEALVSVTDYDTMTTRPTWDYIINRTRLPRSTMHRHLHTLRQWGIVGTVATGRTAQYAAKGPDGEKINEAAVYVLAIPARFAGRPAPRKQPCPPTRTLSPTIGNPGAQRVIHTRSVQENGTPTAVGGYLRLREEITHARAREEASAETATRSAIYAGGRWTAAQARYPHHRQVLLWSPHQRTASKKQRQRAAAELKRRFPAIFRRMSPADIASTLRTHLKAGWTVKDITTAMEYQPNGTRWPHTCSPSSTDAWCARAWLAYRIGKWTTTDGEPLTSPSQRHATEQAQRTAQQRRHHEEQQRRQQNRAAPDSPRKAAALARIKAVLPPVTKTTAYA